MTHTLQLAAKASTLLLMIWSRWCRSSGELIVMQEDGSGRATWLTLKLTEVALSDLAQLPPPTPIAPDLPIQPKHEKVIDDTETTGGKPQLAFDKENLYRFYVQMVSSHAPSLQDVRLSKWEDGELCPPFEQFALDLMSTSKIRQRLVIF